MSPERKDIINTHRMGLKQLKLYFEMKKEGRFIQVTNDNRYNSVSIILSDEDHNDYEDVPKRLLSSFLDRGLLAGTEINPSLDISITKYKLKL